MGRARVAAHTPGYGLVRASRSAAATLFVGRVSPFFLQLEHLSTARSVLVQCEGLGQQVVLLGGVHSVGSLPLVGARAALVAGRESAGSKCNTPVGTRSSAAVGPLVSSLHRRTQFARRVAALCAHIRGCVVGAFGFPTARVPCCRKGVCQESRFGSDSGTALSCDCPRFRGCMH